MTTDPKPLPCPNPFGTCPGTKPPRGLRAIFGNYILHNPSLEAYNEAV